jgi:hypothetical protein
LWRASEHLDQVIVQAIEQLALERPFELWMVKIARVHLEVIRVHGDSGILETDDDFDSIAFFPGTEVEQWVFIETQLFKHTIEAGHGVIVNEATRTVALQ